MHETIKEYLVSLGFEVDESSHEKANEAVSSIGKRVVKFVMDVKQSIKAFEGFAAEVTVNMAKAATMVGGFVTAAAAGTGKLLNGLGDQEIQMEMLARQMWTTQQQAQAFALTLKAMGANLQQLYLSPTLMEQYRELNAVAQKMQPPADYNQQIQLVQSISLQFKQMKLEAAYAFQWIGYYFIKYMAGPLTKLRDILQSINAAIVENMPSWTQTVAKVMASFWQGAVYVVQALGSVYDWLKTILSYMPGWSKGVIAAMAGLRLAMAANPFMLFVIGLTAVILLLDDFYTYIHGGQAALGPFWQWLMKVTDGFKQFGSAKSIGKELQKVFNDLAHAFGTVIIFAENLFRTFQKNGTITEYVNGWKSYFKALQDVGSAINSIVDGIGHLYGELTNRTNQGDLTNFFQLIMDMGTGAMNVIAGTIEEIASLGKAVGYALQGKWKEVGNTLQDMWTGQNLANLGIIRQTDVAGATGPAIGPRAYPYMFQSVPHVNNTNNNVTINQTNHIQTNDPQGTVNAIQNQMTPILMRNLQGMIR